jgi:hypothetical protein
MRFFSWLGIVVSQSVGDAVSHLVGDVVAQLVGYGLTQLFEDVMTQLVGHVEALLIRDLVWHRNLGKYGDSVGWGCGDSFD